MDDAKEGCAFTRAAQLGGADFAGLALVVLVTFFVRFIPAYTVGVEVADLSMYRQMGLAVQRGQDIYDVPHLYHYTPLSLFIPSYSLHLSDTFHQPFHLVMKVYPMLADVGIALLAFLLVRQRRGVKWATLAGLAYGLNPVSILITGFHGQFMPVSVFFAFWAYYLMEARNRDRTYVLSAMSLGIGIALRAWPILTLPFLLRRGMLTWRQRFTYVAVAALPSVLTLGPYLPVNFAGINREVFNYESTTDFGWMGIWRCIWYLQTGNVHLPGGAPTFWLSQSRLYFLYAWAVLVGIMVLRPYATDTAGWISSALLLNYTILGGLASQYLGWVVPFLLFRPLYSTFFSLLAAGAMITFYLTWFPSILLGPYPFPFELTRPQIVTWNMVFLAATWLAGIVWLLRLLWWIVKPAASNTPEVATDAGIVQPTYLDTSANVAAASSRWTTIGCVVLAGWVLGTVAVEIPYIIDSRPAAALPVALKWSVGTRGSKPGEVDAPIALLAHPSGDIYVADLGNARVQRFSSEGVFLGLWHDGVDGSPSLANPTDLVAGSHGEVYALDAGVGAIFRLEADGRVALLIPLGPLMAFTPRGLAMDESRGRFYVTDTGHGALLVLGMDGRLIARWGGDGTPLAFGLGWALGLDKEGNLFVLERGSCRVRKLSPEGALLTEWRIKGEPADLAVGPDERVYVTASDRSSLWVFDAEGRAVGQAAVPRQPQARGIALVAPGDVVMGTEASFVRFSLQFP
jgi:sugar lactone lactonase YvrE